KYMHQFTRRTSTEYCDGMITQPPDRIQIEHSNYLFCGIVSSIVDIIRRAEQNGFFASKGNKNDGTLWLPFRNNMPCKLQHNGNPTGVIIRTVMNFSLIRCAHIRQAHTQMIIM